MIWTLFFLRRKTPSSELSNNLRNGQNAVFFSDHFHNDGVAEKIRHKLARANVRFPAVANSASSCTVNTCLEKIVLCSLQIYVRPVEKTHVSESNKIYFVSPTLPQFMLFMVLDTLRFAVGSFSNNAKIMAYRVGLYNKNGGPPEVQDRFAEGPQFLRSSHIW